MKRVLCIATLFALSNLANSLFNHQVFNNKRHLRDVGNVLEYFLIYLRLVSRCEYLRYPSPIL